MGLLKRLSKSSSAKLIAVFAGGNAIAAVLGGIGGLLQACWVGPDDLGELAKYGILTSYLTILGVLTTDGLARQYPYLIGKGEKEKAIALAATAKTWYLWRAWLSAALFLGLALWALCKADYRAAAGWGAQIVVSAATTYGVYLQLIYRRSMEFKRLSYNSVISSVVSFCSLVAVKLLGYYGLIVKLIALNASRVYLDAKYIPVRIKAAWNKKDFFSLAKISIPLSLEGYIRTSFTGATFAFLVVHFCGQRDLGLYGIATSFETFAMLFVTSMMQIFDVKITNKYGETESVAKISKTLVLPTLFGFAAAIFFAVALCLVIGPFVRFFLPKYVDAIPVVYILSCCIPFVALIIPVRLLRVALLYKSIYLVAFVQVFVLIVTAAIVPKSIEWLAGCKVFAEFISICAGYLMLFLAIRHEKRIESKVS